MADFEKIIPWILYQEDSKAEPGKIVDLGDGGGKTRLGLTERWHAADAPADFFTTMEFGPAVQAAKAAYKKNEWTAINGDQIQSDPVAAYLLSFSVNDNPRTAVKTIQGLLLVKEDGFLGPETIAKLNSKEPELVTKFFRQDWANFYQRLVSMEPNKKPFLQGWLNRVGFDYPNIIPNIYG